MWITDENSLWVFIPIMAVLALVGVLLGGTHEWGTFHYAGIALFIVSVLSIFLNLKAYYDAKDRRRHGH